MARRRIGALARVAVVIGVVVGHGIAASGQAPSPRWVTAWATSPQALGQDTLTDATVRMIVRVTLAGESVRVRLDNSFGTDPLVIGAASVGARMRRAAVVPGSNHALRFEGASTVTIPAGGSVRSDPVPLPVLARQELAVSLYVPGADVRASQHRQAYATSYVSANGAGDVAADETGEPFTATTTSLLWVKAVDVLTSSSAGAIVAFGDSITDGTCSTLDAHDRWEDWLDVRLLLADGPAQPAVLNEGIGGNTITRPHLTPPPDSTPGLERFDRDVLSHQGVSHVVLFMGTNDIRRGASAEQVIGGMEEIVQRVHDQGLEIFGVTIIPRHDRPPSGSNTGWDATKTGIRNEVNAWIRTSQTFDGVIDFDEVVRDPANPDQIFPPFNCDGIHPTPRGYFEMGRAVPLELFRP